MMLHLHMDVDLFDKLHPMQVGFVPGKAQSLITSRIEQALKDNNIALGVFLDIKGTYFDRVREDKLLEHGCERTLVDIFA